MSLARFYSRIANAVGSLVGSSGDLTSFLSETAVALQAASGVPDDPSHHEGFLLATNLCARFYPRLHIVGPKELQEECAALALRINPQCDIDTASHSSAVTLAWGCRSTAERQVVVSPVGWRVRVDQPSAEELVPTNLFTSLTAANLGVGELFRTIFARFLPFGRACSTPGTFPLLTLEETAEDPPELPHGIPLGRVHLAGAGAVGQAALYTLARLPVTGTLVAVDPESLALSNLQRYVLAFDDDVGRSKCALAARALSGTRLAFEGVEAEWGADQLNLEPVECVCTALDTVAARIGVQVGLPHRIYNAWTQPADVGWSRHEVFGEEPCLGCLYIPSGPRPSQHELIGRALRQADLRVLAYLTANVPVNRPLQPEQLPRLVNLPLPPDSASWVERSILEDIGQALQMDSSQLSAWNGKQISDLYQEGICGGAIVSDTRGDLPQDVAVPLAHQSAFAGVMLALELVVSSTPELRSFRSPFVEARFDVLAGLPQVFGRPRQRTQGCFCTDESYLARYRKKWNKNP